MIDAKHRVYIWKLIKERERMFALLLLLEANIGICREIEQLRSLPIKRKRSIEAERVRASLQADMARINGEIEAALDLIGRCDE